VRTRPLIPAVAGLAIAALAFGTAAPHAVATVATAARVTTECPAGTLPEKDVSLSAFAAGSRRACTPALRVEKTAEIMGMGQQLAVRQNGGHLVAAGALEAAVVQHQALVKATATGTAPSWTPVGVGPLNADVAGFGSTNALGLHQLAGRIEDFAYDPAGGKTFYAAVANGGIWRTTDGGSSWKSIGDTLPTQITGAVELLKKGTAITVLAGTGDPAYGGSSFAGLGIYWSTGSGRWTKSTGVPDGALSFNFDHDPSTPDVVYAATSKGLYRSTNAGRSFVNVVLPTTCTNVKDPVCYFANMVSDVLVRPAGHGHAGGAVLAAVGWRAGQKLNKVGKPQSPRNGLYSSDSGLPGSFGYQSNAAGFATNDIVGRVALGGATGPSQDHGYVYALVQDALKFNKGANAFDIPDVSGKSPNNTVFNGLYGSKDFGKTWTKLADAQQLQIPGSGTALTGANAATYAPGIQSWYNEWIQVDPTVQDEAGVPARIGFGLEEVWTGAGAIPVTPNSGQYKVVGRYFSGASCAGLNLGGLEGSTDGPCPFTTGDLSNQGSTTHPDQHAGAFIPDTGGGVTLLVGNDGGAYKQKLARGGQLTNKGWGNGLNNGFNTLLPYDAAISTDGTVVEGLQDNGSATIDPTTGKQTMAYGGDGFFVAIDPDNSRVWYEEYVGGGIRVTTDGGRSWSTIDPGLSSALFSTPFVLDTTNHNHLVIGGREIAETLKGKSTNGPTNFEKPDINAVGTPSGDGDWVKVFDLGTAQHPGSNTAGKLSPNSGQADPTSTEIPNQMSAVDTREDNTYVAYCGFCDIVTGGTPFHSGIATNVGGAAEPKAGTTRGWHIAAAKGLPERYVNSVRIDPANPRTVYATLGGYGRRWIPPGSLGDDVSKIGKGHVYKSTDAGETFKDISGNLPDIGADDAFPFNGKLVVATDLGTYIGGLNGGKFLVLGKGLPAAPVFRLNRSPRNPRELIAASYGRGVYRITLPAGYAGQPATVTSVFRPPVIKPPVVKPGAGGLAATGLPLLPVGVGAGLLLLAVGLRRRLRRT
jgi:hypothetical protein